jgi:hypothetical protein
VLEPFISPDVAGLAVPVAALPGVTEGPPNCLVAFGDILSIDGARSIEPETL